MQKLQKDNLLSTSQVAELLGVTRITVFRWIKDGVIEATKVGRNYVVTPEALACQLNTQTLSESQKSNIKQLIDKAVHDYGETIRMLGRE